MQKVSGFAEGVAHGVASLRVRKSPRRAYETGREAAQRREQEIADELAEVARALSADAITLSIPHAKPYHGVARLVVGGLAARLELTYEHLEDLQLALATRARAEGYVRR